MEKRIFVAIKISERLEREVAPWENELLADAAFAHPSMNAIRWLRGKNLHITLVPPWYEADASRTVAALRTIAGRAEPFAVRFNAITYGPDPRRPRLIWATGETPRALGELKILTERTLGKVPEARPFRLHLTLARFRAEDFAQFKTRSLNEKISWQDEVRSLVLMETHLSPAGADYEILEKVAF